MFIFDLQILYLGIGLLGLIIINILLGSVGAILERKFDKTNFKNGIIKGVIVAVCFVGVYFIGLLTPNIIVMQINGQEVTLLTAIQIILLTSFLYYVKEVIKKLASFINAKYEAKQDTITSDQGQTIINIDTTNSAAQMAAAIKAGDRGSGEDSSKFVSTIT